LLKEEKKAIDEVFRTLDLNSDGQLTPDEIKIGYQEFYDKELTDEEVSEIVRRVDFRKTGAIDYSEFVVASMFERNLLDEKRLKAAFKMFDKDRDGYIDANNLKKVLASFGDSNKEMDDYINNKIIKEFDRDGDGKISYQDFKAMMFQTVQEQPIEGKRHSLTKRAKRRSFVAAVDAGSLLGIEDGSIGPDAEELQTSAASPKSKTKKRGSIKDVKGAFEFMSVFETAKDTSSNNPIFRPSIPLSHIRSAIRAKAARKKNALPARTTTRETVSMALDGSRRDSISLLKNNPLHKTSLIDEDDQSDSE
jgi:Ca2+-binding EF-hand superfamily protein